NVRRNVISGNGATGVFVFNASAAGVTVQGNYIGTNKAGDAAVPNLGNGVSIRTSNAVVVGGTQPGDDNLISGNRADGLSLYGGGHHLVAGNFIGTDKSGTAPVPNTGIGVLQSSGNNNTIGGATDKARNVIAANGRSGIDVESALGGSTALIQGNYI